jgi:ABC-type glycerol-3-phosphate transport system substrate-binding protein
MLTLDLRRNLILTPPLLILLIACVPPTPPPRPTPVSTPTPMPVEVTYQIQQTPVGPTATPQAKPALTPATATIVVWESLPESQTQALAEDIQAFQDEFPQYTVSLQHYHQPESFMTPLTAGQISFDVALVSPALLGNLWAAGHIAPMSNFFPSSFINDFASVTLRGASQDGELWGLSDTAGFHLLLFYNRDLVDTPPTNTTELFNLAQEFTRQNNQSQGQTLVWGLAVNSYDPLWLVPWLTPYGGWLTDETGQPTLNTPAMEAAITLYLSWQGRLTGIAPVATHEEARTRFLNGDIPMLIDGEWAIAELARTDKINWGVALLPNVGQAEESQPAAPLVLARYWVISRTAISDRALASAAFLEYITRPERQLAWTIRFGLLPTRRGALDDLVIVNDFALRISAAQMLAGRTVSPGVNVDEILKAMREPLRGVIDGELTPQEAAEMMQTNLEEK